MLFIWYFNILEYCKFISRQNTALSCHIDGKEYEISSVYAIAWCLSFFYIFTYLKSLFVCRKKNKMTDKPKRPMSAYMIWLNSAREQIKSEHPGLKVTEIAKKGGEMWKSMKDKSVSIQL